MLYLLPRVVALKGSSFDGRKQLLEALRMRFPDGTLTLGVEATNKDVLDYWHSLQEDYRFSADGEERICFGTSCYGLQDDSNYWFLGPQVIKHIRVQNYLISFSL